MTNDQMTKARWLRLHQSRKAIKWCEARISEGLAVYFSTYAKHIKFSKPAHLEALKATKSGLYMRQGRSWVYAGGCKVTAS